MTWLPPDERVVVTGMGGVTPNGLDMASSWSSVRDGRSGIGPITQFDVSELNVQIAGEAHGFDPRSFMNAKEARRTDRFVQMSIAAMLEAVAQSRLQVGPHNADDTGVFIGCGTGGSWTYIEQWEAMRLRGPKAMSPIFVPMVVPDAASVTAAILLGARGPTLGISTACSTGLDAIGLALETIRRGDAQVMLAGGAESAVNPFGIVGFDRLGALSRRNDDPAGACRPFDRGRDGFVLSEGAVVLVLESLKHAHERGATPLAEIRSYAATSDGIHLTAPDEQGRSAARCIARALAKGAVDADEIDYVSAHAPGTPLGDPIEANVIRSALGARAPEVPVSATKSSTGHLLGAAGAYAVALTIAGMEEGCLPPTINLTDPDPKCDIQHVANVAKPADTHTALVPAYGFGGHNSCVVLRKWVG